MTQKELFNIYPVHQSDTLTITYKEWKNPRVANMPGLINIVSHQPFLGDIENEITVFSWDNDKGAGIGIIAGKDSYGWIQRHVEPKSGKAFDVRIVKLERKLRTKINDWLEENFLDGNTPEPEPAPEPAPEPESPAPEQKTAEKAKSPKETKPF